MGYSLGVDLGTTFVAAALAVDGRAEMFTLGDRSEVTPSVVYLREDNTLVTGDAAANLRTTAGADRVAREFKRRLGDPTPVVLGGRSYAATELLGAQLRDVLDRVIASEGSEPDNVVLTHPANWGPFRRTLFDGVLHFGELASALKVTEPEAAAARYAGSRSLGDGQMVAVYDLGGGTFDATILRKIPGGMEIVGIPEGIERLGGIDFDEAILRYVNFTSDNALNDLDMRDAKTTVALARLRQDCVLAKEALSADTETVLPVFLPDRHFDVRLDRKTFEDLIRAQVESTVGALSRTLDSAQVSPEELHAVLLIGGSSRIPLVATMLAESLGRPIAIDTHPKYAVALGAATLADRAHGTPAVSAAYTKAPTPTGAPAPPATAAAKPPSAPAAPKPPTPPSAAPSTPLSTPPSTPGSAVTAMPMPAPPSAPAAMPAPPAPAPPVPAPPIPAPPILAPPVPAPPAAARPAAARPAASVPTPSAPVPSAPHPAAPVPPAPHPAAPVPSAPHPAAAAASIPAPMAPHPTPPPAPVPFAAVQITPQPPPAPLGHQQPPPGHAQGQQPGYHGQPYYNPGPQPGQPQQQPGYPQQQPGYPHGQPGHSVYQVYQGQPGYPQPTYQGQPGYGQPVQQAQAGYGPYQQQAYSRPPQQRRKKSGAKRVLVSFIVLAVLAMAGAAAYLVFRPDLTRFGIGTPQAASTGAASEVTPSALGVQARVVLTAEEVKGGDTYSVTATGFNPGEIVELTWTGPTQGTMGSGPADPGGIHIMGPIVERDPPGTYEIIATGLQSGRTAKTPLEVVASDAPDN